MESGSPLDCDVSKLYLTDCNGVSRTDLTIVAVPGATHLYIVPTDTSLNLEYTFKINKEYSGDYQVLYEY